jgi:hypothetical protein
MPLYIIALYISVSSKPEHVELAPATCQSERGGLAAYLQVELEEARQLPGRHVAHVKRLLTSRSVKSGKVGRKSHKLSQSFVGRPAIATVHGRILTGPALQHTVQTRELHLLRMQSEWSIPQRHRSHRWLTLTAGGGFEGGQKRWLVRPPSQIRFLPEDGRYQESGCW